MGSALSELCCPTKKTASEKEPYEKLMDSERQEDDGTGKEKRNSIGAAPLDDEAMAEVVRAVTGGFDPITPESIRAGGIIPEATVVEPTTNAPLLAGMLYDMPSIEEPTTVSPITGRRRSIVEEMMAATISSEQSPTQKRQSLGFETTFDIVDPLTGTVPSTIEEAGAHYSTLVKDMEEGVYSDEEIQGQFSVFQETVQSKLAKLDEATDKSKEEKERAKRLLRQDSMHKWSTTHIDTQQKEMMEQLLFLQGATDGADTGGDMQYMQQLIAARGQGPLAEEDSDFESTMSTGTEVSALST